MVNNAIDAVAVVVVESRRVQLQEVVDVQKSRQVRVGKGRHKTMTSKSTMIRFREVRFALQVLAVVRLVLEADVAVVAVVVIVAHDEFLLVPWSVVVTPEHGGVAVVDVAGPASVGSRGDGLLLTCLGASLLLDVVVALSLAELLSGIGTEVAGILQTIHSFLLSLGGSDGIELLGGEVEIANDSLSEGAVTAEAVVLKDMDGPGPSVEAAETVLLVGIEHGGEDATESSFHGNQNVAHDGYDGSSWSRAVGEKGSVGDGIAFLERAFDVGWYLLVVVVAVHAASDATLCSSA